MSSYSFRGGGGGTNLPSLSTRSMSGGGNNNDDNNNEFEPLHQSVGGSSSFDLSYRSHPAQQQEEETFEDEHDENENENENFLRNIVDPLERDARDAIRERILFRKLMVSIPALTTVCVNIYAIIFTFFVVSASPPATSISGILVLISGVIATVVSTVIFITEIFIVDDIQTLVEFDQNEVILLKTQQARLISKEKRLQLNVFCLKEDERRLICEMNDPHKGRKYLMGIVKKYKKQMISKTDAYRQYLVADIMNLIIRADKDESGDFDDGEIKHLIRYIKALPTVKVNEKKLSKAIKKERSLYSVLSLVQDLSSNKKNIPAKKRIFTFDDKQVEIQVIALSKKHEQQTTTLSSTSSNERGRKGNKPSLSRGRSKSPKSKNPNDDDGGGSSKRRLSKKKSSKKGTTTRSERSLSPNSKLRSPTTTDDSSSRIGELKHPIGSGGFGPSSSSSGGKRGRSRSKSPTLSGPSGRGMTKSRSLSPTPSKDRSIRGRSVSPLGLKNVKKGLSTFLSSTNRLKKDDDNNSKGKKGGGGGGDGSKGDHLSSFF